MREVRSEEAVAMRGRVGWIATDQARSGWGGREVTFWSFIIAIWRGMFGGAETRNDDNTARSLGCRNISTSRRARHNAVNRSQSLSPLQYFPPSSLRKMCGILFAVSPAGAPAPLEASAPLAALIARRGPDSTHTHETTFRSYTLTFTSSVLSLRGAHVTPQPLVDPSTGSVLCWNGEAWRIGDDALLPGANDGEEVFKLLLAAGAGTELKNALESIAGPYALVYYDAVAGRVWFGRDSLGRRSLLYRGLGVGLEKGFVIASVGDGSAEAGWKEVEADGLRYLDLVTGGQMGWVPFMWEEDAVAEGRREFMVTPP